MKRNPSRSRLKVTTGGKGVVGHAGARLPCDLADAVGRCVGLSEAMAPTKQRWRGHDRGRVLVDLAVMIADGGEAISDLAVLRDQPALFGEVASTPTAWRTLEAVDGDALARMPPPEPGPGPARGPRGPTRGSTCWTSTGPHRLAFGETGSRPDLQAGFGFHPLLVFLDATGEALAGILRPGNRWLEHCGP